MEEDGGSWVAMLERMEQNLSSRLEATIFLAAAVIEDLPWPKRSFWVCLG